MGILAVDLFVTLDGVYQAPGAPDEDREGGFEYGGWQGAYFDDESGAYIGAGIGVQLRNGSGTLIDGTFIDDALDQLAAAGNISIGLEARVAPGLYLTGDVRGMLSVGLATVSARAGC